MNSLCPPSGGVVVSSHIARKVERREGWMGRSAQAGVKGRSLGARLPEFESWLCPLLALQPQAGDWPSLNLFPHLYDGLP